MGNAEGLFGLRAVLKGWAWASMLVLELATESSNFEGALVLVVVVAVRPGSNISLSPVLWNTAGSVAVIRL